MGSDLQYALARQSIPGQCLGLPVQCCRKRTPISQSFKLLTCFLAGVPRRRHLIQLVPYRLEFGRIIRARHQFLQPEQHIGGFHYPSSNRLVCSLWRSQHLPPLESGRRTFDQCHRDFEPLGYHPQRRCSDSGRGNASRRMRLVADGGMDWRCLKKSSLLPEKIRKTHHKNSSS